MCCGCVWLCGTFHTCSSDVTVPLSNDTEPQWWYEALKNRHQTFDPKIPRCNRLASIKKLLNSRSWGTNLREFGAKNYNFGVLLRILRVHVGRSNGRVVKPSLLFECLAFALSVRVRRKPTTFFAHRRKSGEQREKLTAQTERDNRLDDSNSRGWITTSYLDTPR
ncbi:hypothetical protein PROFUN_05958 [Planoprotostelium fungivorum]|uniref:Secreted protein n=1 Tax=Planoprotostelium fungivorum TaxID=1890364 RepID=A0A2P6N7Q4_9EUKA|nr:hypothetical protein PROFUN_05958 [Planoprotostelium fungivorum]